MSVLLTKLLPNQVVANWDYIKKTLSVTLPPYVEATEEVLSNLLNASLAEELQIWMLHESDFENDTSKIIAIATTTITYDKLSGIRTLLIYSLFGNPESNGKADWYQGLNGIKKYAKAKKCSSITAYSNIPMAIKLAERLGGDISFRYIKLEV